MPKSTKEEDNFKKGIKGIWRHLRDFKGKLITISILGLISAAANGAVPYISGKFFDSLIDISNGVQDEGFPLWATLLIIWSIIQVVANNIDWIIDRFGRYVDTKTHLNIEASGFSHLFKLPISFHKNQHIQELIHRITNAGWRIANIIRGLTDLVPQLLSVFIGLILSLTINVTLALVLVAGIVLYSIILMKIVPTLTHADRESQKHWSESFDQATSSVNQIESVKQAAAEEYEFEKIQNQFLEKTFQPWYKMQLSWSNVNFFQRIIVFLTQLTIFILSVHLIRTGVISVGELIAINGYSVMFFGPFVALGHRWQVFQNGLTAASRIERIFEEETEIYQPPGAVTEEIVGKVSFENVSFTYQQEENVLHDISFTAEPSESIALVGESGSGKSTLISLISGYYFPQHGEVRIDDIRTDKYDLTSLRKQIAVVPQEIALFNDTIEHNIRYGNFEARMEDVQRVAEESHLAEFIHGLSLGYQTLVGERGVKLSVGQKQRLAIARAMLRDPKILILDEPTSALDAMTEKFVTEALEQLTKDRTTFIIAHRLSTVRKADKIFVFDRGRIVESGTHQELIKQDGGVYKRLHDYQIGIY